jgi:hypothetical protein
MFFVGHVQAKDFLPSFRSQLATNEGVEGFDRDHGLGVLAGLEPLQPHLLGPRRLLNLHLQAGGQQAGCFFTMALDRAVGRKLDGGRKDGVDTSSSDYYFGDGANDVAHGREVRVTPLFVGAYGS